MKAHANQELLRPHPTPLTPNRQMVVSAGLAVAGQGRPNAGGISEGDAVFRIGLEGSKFFVFDRLA